MFCRRDQAVPPRRRRPARPDALGERRSRVRRRHEPRPPQRPHAAAVSPRGHRPQRPEGQRRPHLSGRHPRGAGDVGLGCPVLPDHLHHELRPAPPAQPATGQQALLHDRSPGGHGCAGRRPERRRPSDLHPRERSPLRVAEYRWPDREGAEAERGAPGRLPPASRRDRHGLQRLERHHHAGAPLLLLVRFQPVLVRHPPRRPSGSAPASRGAGASPRERQGRVLRTHPQSRRGHAAVAPGPEAGRRPEVHPRAGADAHRTVEEHRGACGTGRIVRSGRARAVGKRHGDASGRDAPWAGGREAGLRRSQDRDGVVSAGRERSCARFGRAHDARCVCRRVGGKG